MSPPPAAAAAISVEEQLWYPIHLCERIKKSATEATSFKSECSSLASHADLLSSLLRSSLPLSSPYPLPLLSLSSLLTPLLLRSLSFTRKSRRRLLPLPSDDFRKLHSLLSSSSSDLRWLLSILDHTNKDTINLSLPPFATNDPLLAWVWSFISSLYSPISTLRIDAAELLSSLALDNDRNKQMIADQGGIPPLLKLLKEELSHSAQIAASSALFHVVGNDRERANSVVVSHGVPVIVHALQHSPMKVQIGVARLVSRLSELDPVAREDFARENVIRPLVGLLSYETFDEEDRKLTRPSSIGSIVEISRERSRFGSLMSFQSDGGSSRGGMQLRRERESESAEVKRELKVSCAEAVRMLAKGSVVNSTRITETKGLLCLAKLVEKESGELRTNCLMAVMEITTAAESCQELRRSAFKTNSPAPKAVVSQLLRVIRETRDDSSVLIPAIRSIGCLSRTFPTRETRVIGPLVDHLSSKDHEVAIEAVIALEKFATPDNFLCNEHSKSIIEFSAVLPLLRLLRGNDRLQLHALVLLCYLCINSSNSEELEQARVLTTLESAHLSAAAQQQPDLKELIARAVSQLRLYIDGGIVNGLSLSL